MSKSYPSIQYALSIVAPEGVWLALCFSMSRLVRMDARAVFFIRIVKAVIATVTKLMV
jgi:hypothetical protein